MTVPLLQLPRTLTVDANGEPRSNAKLYVFAAQTTNPVVVWQDPDLTIPHPVPIRSNAEGTFPPIYADPTLGDIKINITDEDDIQIPGYPIDNIPAPFDASTQSLGALFNARTDAESLLGITPLNYIYPSGDVRRYGSNFGLVAANDTAALNAMFKVCIQGAKTGGASSCPGYIAAGTYLIQEGVLAFDTPFIDAPFPIINTAGNNVVILRGIGFADAPILTFTNGTATSTAGQYWRDGYLGPLWFKTTRTSGTNSHGLSLRGLQNVFFGAMRGESLSGSVVYQPAAKFNTTDPDPYAVQECYFDGIYSVGCQYSLNNQNDVGFTCNFVRLVVGNMNTLGVIFSGGDQNVFACLTCGNSMGFAYDEGQSGATISGASRNVILGAEIDTCQYGIRVNKCFGDRFTGIRFIHRYNFGINSSNAYWPLACVDIGGGVSPNIQQFHVECMHRIEAGGPNKGTLGAFVDFHNISGSTLSSVEIHQEYLDEGTGFTFIDTDFYSNIGTFPNALGAVFLSGRRIYDSRIASVTMVCGTGATSILHTGFNTASNIVQFPTAVNDRNNCFNTSTGVWTAPYSGLARVEASVPLTMAASTPARMAIMELTGGGAYNATVLYSEQWSVTTSVQHYKIAGLIQVQQGFKYCLSMDQGTAGNLTPSLPSGAFIADLYLHIEMCSAP